MKEYDKKKLFFYAPAALTNALTEQAEKEKKSVSEVIVDILSKELNIQRTSETDIADKIIAEIREYAESMKQNSFSMDKASAQGIKHGEFTLNSVSKTYSNCGTFRASMGRRIAVRIANGEIKGVEASRTVSGSVRRLRTGEALYKITCNKEFSSND